MGIRVPVYDDSSGAPHINLYEETGEGTFRRTPEQALGALRQYIIGISPPIGTLMAQRFDRSERPWQSPTVSPHSGRAASYYAFLRAAVRRRRLLVMTTPALAGRIHRFAVHQLLLKPDMSTQAFTLMADKYLEVLELLRAAPATVAEPAPEEAADAAPRDRNVRELSPRLKRLLGE